MVSEELAATPAKPAALEEIAGMAAGAEGGLVAEATGEEVAVVAVAAAVVAAVVAAAIVAAAVVVVAAAAEAVAVAEAAEAEVAEAEVAEAEVAEAEAAVDSSMLTACVSRAHCSQPALAGVHSRDVAVVFLLNDSHRAGRSAQHCTPMHGRQRLRR